MPFHENFCQRLHPIAARAYMLAVEHGSITHPINVAFAAEIACEMGEGLEMLAEVYEIINERRMAAGLPAVSVVL
jgi:hypothetical protein